ncbi:uncharacterized protein EI90DRAFT_3063153 [Cantharellus anzutake]|uniref:uncharacterized protein n=1 Tax=Cantharellus anzutake TaxID=1750568 RepID=UPI0019057D0D|nr:uncharacterized protein EI90DRAFT_3063153 [Cantharellus anzutake]KAF8329085.1 hypothetical protein EI90DRAFT_3063153 [Cantharellus anzutake]
MEDEQPFGLRALCQAFSVIIVSEIGDKTFLIAAILAMRHDRATVFAGAFGSLLLMSILSAVIGLLLPSLIPRKLAQLAAALLFMVFGIRMLLEGQRMTDGNEKMQEEIREAEEEIEEADAVADGTGLQSNGEVVPLEVLEGGGCGRADHRRNFSVKPHGQLGRPKIRSPPPRLTQDSLILETRCTQLKKLARRTSHALLGPVFVKTFTLTFLGEWGDRSQVATIALAAAHNVYLVAFGTLIGHACCTGLAVLGGRWISTKISIKKVTLGGACLFLLFSVLYLAEALFMPSFNPAVDLSKLDDQ